MSRDKPKDADTLLAELHRLGERVEIQMSYIDVLERTLTTLFQQDGLEVMAVEIDDAIRPLHGGNAMPEAANEADASAGPTVGAPREDFPFAPSWWPRPVPDDRALAPSAGWRNYTLHKHALKVIGVSVCGLPRLSLVSAVAGIAREQGRLRDFIPVFLTDSVDFDVFRRHGYVFEYFPAADRRAQYGGTTSWAQYAAERRRLLERKWALDAVIRIGPREFGVVPDADEAPATVAS